MRSMLFSLGQTRSGISAGLRVTAKLFAIMVTMLALQFTIVSAAHAATPKIMVVGDSISAGFEQASYRKALLDGLDAANCSVDMVGGETLNSYSFNDPVNLPGVHENGFSPANGYDTDHQAFGGIRAEQIFTGFTSGANETIESIATYASIEQPDYVLLHAGTNDLGNAISNGIDASGIDNWATTTTNDMDNIIDSILDVVPGAKIIVGNFIPRKKETGAAEIALEAQMNVAYRNKLTARISSRGDSRVLLADVATGFNSGSMTDDGVHPNPVGEEHLAGAFETVLFGAGLCSGTSPAVTSPASGSVIEGTTATLDWTNNGVAVNEWWVYAGANQSGNADDYFNSGRITNGGARSIQLTGLPADGSQVSVGLWYKVGSMWDFTLVNYTNNATGGGGGGDTPAVTSPADGSAISGSSFTLNWSANGESVTDWWVFAGSSAIDDQSDNYFNSDRISNSSASSVVVSGMPEDGSLVYLRLWFKIAGTWNHETLAYTSTDSGSGGTTPPSISAPAPGSTINGTSAVLSWNANDVSASGWQVNVGSSAGSSNIFTSADLPGSATSTSISNLPNDGTPIFVTLSYEVSGGASDEVSASYTSGTGSSGGDSPAVTSPAPGSLISGNSFTLSWSANGASVDEWWIFAGDSSASQDDDYFNSGRLSSSANSTVVTDMPEDGSTVHVALWFKIAGTWNSETYTYTSADSGSGGGTTPPALTSPTAGSNIAGTSAVFSWTANDTTVTRWQLRAGSTSGGNQYDSTGNLGAATTSAQLDNLPNDGSLVFVTLRYDDGSGFTNVTTSYTSGTATGGGDTPAITSPAEGSSISGSSFALNWSRNGENVSDWWVFAGASAASQSDDYFNSNRISNDNATSVTVTGMPQDGSTVFVALWFKVAGIWSSEVVTYTSASNGGGGSTPPAITSPAAGSTINGTSATFSWATNGTAVSSLQIDVGSSSGGAQYDSTGSIAASTGSAVLTNLPNDGSTIFVTLRYTSGGSNLSSPSVSYTSGTAGGGGGGDLPAISSPADGSTINGASYTLNWNRNGANVSEYYVFMGNNPTSRFPNEYFESGRICVLNSAGNPKSGANDCEHEISDTSSNSFVVTGMPQNGSEVIVALWFKINGVWQVKPRLELDRYISASAGGGGGGGGGTGTGVPEISGPADGSSISGNSFNFSWDGNGAAVTDWWVFAGTDASNDQSSDVFDSGRITNSSTSSSVVTGMPQDGSTVYVRLWYKSANVWSHIEYSYTSANAGGTVSTGNNPPPPPTI